MNKKNDEFIFDLSEINFKNLKQKSQDRVNNTAQFLQIFGLDVFSLNWSNRHLGFVARSELTKTAFRMYQLETESPNWEKTKTFLESGLMEPYSDALFPRIKHH
jgi:hypothetical protein